MTTYVVTDPQGKAVSIGTVVADPLPAHLTAHALAEDAATALTTGTGRWDPATLTVVPVPAEPGPTEITLADVAAALRDPLADLTPSSESTTVRTAILNQRAALDALLGQLETP